MPGKTVGDATERALYGFCENCGVSPEHLRRRYPRKGEIPFDSDRKRMTTVQAKLCGMKTVEAARAAETAGADFIGFIFWRRSHRFVEPEQAARIAEALQRVKTVGVFVDEEPALVNAVARQCHLDFVQLHGHEDAAYAEQMEVPVIKAYRYGDGFSAEAANAFPAAMILVDAYQKGAAGGTGTCFDWQQAQREVAAVKKPVPP